MSEKQEETKRYRVRQYQTYMELYEDTNLVKRRFLEGETFFVTDDQLNKNQLDRIEEIEQEEETTSTTQESAGNESKPEAKAEVDPKEAARAKLRGGKPAQATQAEQPEDGQESVF